MKHGDINWFVTPTLDTSWYNYNVPGPISPFFSFELFDSANSEGPCYLETPLKPEFLEDKFKVDLLEIKLIYNVTDSLTYCDFPGTTPIVSMSNLKKR